MTTNKILSITCVVAIASTLGLAYFWDDFLGGLSVNVSMDRELALEEAKAASEDFEILGDNLDQAAAYAFSSSLRDYVELKQGGREKFQSIIDSDVFSPYNWVVRTFKEGQVAEATFAFKPDGSSNGYRVKIPEDHDSDSLSEEDALGLIALKINDHWSGNFADYSLIESSFEEMPNSRVDHSFVFEHKLQDIGDAKYRLNVDVSGSMVSSVSPSAFIPESFNREFANIRSDNDTIAMFANFAFLGIYMLVIGVGSIIIFYRTGWLRWKSSLLAAAFIATTSTLVQLNFYPTMWMAYDTATSKSQFMIEGLLAMLANGVVNFLLFGATFVIAESLTRRAFPEHIQLWKTWTMNVANSKRVLNDTVFAYLIVPIKLAIVGAFYILMEKYFGFWSPASSMADPNYLASIFPWYTGIAISLQAGFWEEMLFRAVPIGAGVLIGQRYNMRFTGLAIAMVLQALIFGAGHANYPAQPSYARVVELFLPAFFQRFF
jgi:membrane protease YdiL (CAAX protease family)